MQPVNKRSFFFWCLRYRSLGFFFFLGHFFRRRDDCANGFQFIQIDLDRVQLRLKIRDFSGQLFQLGLQTANGNLLVWIELDQQTEGFVVFVDLRLVRLIELLFFALPADLDVFVMNRQQLLHRIPRFDLRLNIPHSLLFVVDLLVQIVKRSLRFIQVVLQILDRGDLMFLQIHNEMIRRPFADQ